jgi:hypothetical protein
VVFEEYDTPETRTENGIARMPGGGEAAWFKDSEATWSALFQPEQNQRLAQGAHWSWVSSAAAYWLAAWVADRISWVTSCGWVISERWPESISTVVAFMRLARKR